MKVKLLIKKSVHNRSMNSYSSQIFLSLAIFASFFPNHLFSPPTQPLLFASQGAMRDTAERIMELEKALRESMNTAAHREALWAQEEAERVQAQRQVLHGVSHAHRGPKTSKHTHTDTFHLKNQGSREDVKN